MLLLQVIRASIVIGEISFFAWILESLLKYGFVHDLCNLFLSISPFPPPILAYLPHLMTTAFRISKPEQCYVIRTFYMIVPYQLCGNINPVL